MAGFKPSGEITPRGFWCPQGEYFGMNTFKQ